MKCTRNHGQIGIFSRISANLLIRQLGSVLEMSIDKYYLVTFFILRFANFGAAHQTFMTCFCCASLRIEDTLPESSNCVNKNFWESRRKFIQYISDELDAAIGVKWVFIFDRINRLLLKPEHEGMIDIWRFPVSYLHDGPKCYVCRPHNIDYIGVGKQRTGLSTKKNHMRDGLDDFWSSGQFFQGRNSSTIQASMELFEHGAFAFSYGLGSFF